jgi:SHS2 domain-containing protein
MTAPARVEPQHHFVEHGGEVEVELAAENEIGIFAAGLDAFAELVAGSEDGEPTEFQIRLRGRDRTLLLVDWLNELLFLAEVEQFVPRHITSIELGDECLHATVAGDRGTPRPLVKGVALNGLRFEQGGGVWHGRVVLDV